MASSNWIRSLQMLLLGAMLGALFVSSWGHSTAVAQQNSPQTNPAAMQSTDDLRTPGPKELYRMFGLNDRQIALIRDAVPKRDYYVTGPDGCRKVSLGLSALEIAIAGATSETDVLAVREAYQHHGDRWLTEYLAGLGIDYQTIPGREVAYA